MIKMWFLIVAVVLVCLTFEAYSANLKLHKPGQNDKCPVCGMFVARFPDFAAQIHFKDGTVYYFDGNKDIFKYFLNSASYTPGKKIADVTAIYVTSYYDLIPIDGRSAWYVIGSNVLGPMGRELISFAKESEAGDFKKDHKGKRILRFKDITPSVIKELE